MRRLTDERGQSIVEWLGGMVVLLVVVIATFSVKPSLGQQLSCQVGARIDRIISIDQEGSCHSAKPRPDRALLRARAREPYNLSQNRIERNAIRPAP
jgi:hypothetical protein